MVLESLLAKLTASPRGVQRLKIVLASCLGLLFAISYTYHIGQSHLTRRRDLAIMLVYLTGFFAVGAYVLVYRFIIPSLQRASARARNLWVGGALLVSALVVLVAAKPFTIPQRLIITATGQKNAAAQGSEVWVNQILLSDGTQVPVTALQQTGAWEIRNGVPVSHQAQPAVLTWSGQAAGDVRLQFVSHPWSGMVTINRNGHEQTLDLYAPTATTKDIVVTDSGSASLSKAVILRRILLLGVDSVSLGVFVLCSGLWLNKRVWKVRERLDQPGFVFRQVLLIVGILAIPLTLLITPIILADPARPNLLQPVHYVLMWIYATFILFVVVRLWVRESVELLPVPRALPLPLQRTHRGLLGQSVATWICALLAVFSVATVFTHEISKKDARAIWMRIEMNSANGQAPFTTVRYGAAPDDVATVDWQPYNTTDVALRPLGDVSQLAVQRIQTSQGSLPLEQVTSIQASLQQGALVVTQPSGALMTWPQSTNALTLTLAPGTGNAEVLWFDQRAQVALQPQPTQVVLKLPADLQGWALLPPSEVDQLALEIAGGTTTYTIRGIDVLTTPPKPWRATADGAAWQPQGCTLNAQPSSLVVTTVDSTLCTLHVPQVQPINPTHPLRVVAIWIGITLVLLGLLWLCTWVFARVRTRAANYHSVENRFGRWLRQQSQQWNTRRATWIIGSIAMIFHVVYALTVPMTYTNDSVDYYNLGQAFASSFRFASMDSIRTPGYPLFIGMLISVFGDTALWIVIAQHIALALLAPLTVWALARRVPPATAILAGLLVAFLPAVSICANIVWTESLFAAFAAAALLVYIGRGESVRGLLLCGALVGAATMVRPTGLLLLACLVGWLLLESWFSLGNGARQRFALIGSSALVAGYLVTAAPWHIHLRVVRDTFDLARGHAGFTAWAAAIYQGTVDGALPINQTDRAAWNATYAWRGDPFALVNQTPQVRKGDADDVQAYYGESLQEASTVHAARRRDNLVAAFVYNVAFVTGDARFVYWAEISGIGDALRTSVQPPPNPDDRSRPLLDALVYRWQPAHSPLRTLLLNLGLFVLGHWKWIALPLVVSIIVLLLYENLRVFVPAWLYWLGLVLSSTALGMPAERYVAVAEPVLYVILVVALTSLASIWARRLITVHSRNTTLKHKAAEHINV